MNKRVTAAVVIIDPEGNILGCHATGRKENEGYDFPKGMVEEGEDDLSAAVRELSEETGIFLGKDKAKLIDLGVFPHNKEKDIHIFLFRVRIFPPMELLKCESYFEQNGRKLPEVDGFRIISRENRHMFNKVLHNKFNIIDRYNETEEN